MLEKGLEKLLKEPVRMQQAGSGSDLLVNFFIIQTYI